MTYKELQAKYEKFAEPGGPLHGVFTVLKVEPVNYQVAGYAGPPHPFTVGPEHVAYASDRCGGVLGQEVLDKIPCAFRPDDRGGKCGRDYSAHTHETALFLLLTRDLINKEAHAALLAIKAECEKDGLAGWAMPNLGRPFRIAPPKPANPTEEK